MLEFSLTSPKQKKQKINDFVSHVPYILVVYLNIFHTSHINTTLVFLSLPSLSPYLILNVKNNFQFLINKFMNLLIFFYLTRKWFYICKLKVKFSSFNVCSYVYIHICMCKCVWDEGKKKYSMMAELSDGRWWTFTGLEADEVERLPLLFSATRRECIAFHPHSLFFFFYFIYSPVCCVYMGICIFLYI